MADTKKNKRHNFNHNTAVQHEKMADAVLVLYICLKKYHHPGNNTSHSWARAFSHKAVVPTRDQFGL